MLPYFSHAIALGGERAIKVDEAAVDHAAQVSRVGKRGFVLVVGDHPGDEGMLDQVVKGDVVELGKHGELAPADSHGDAADIGDLLRWDVHRAQGSKRRRGRNGEAMGSLTIF